MKNVLVIILLMSCLALSAVSESTLIFTQIQPSNIIRAMGYGYNGVADVWHQNPLIALDNPAMPAMHDGLAFGFTRDNWLKGSGFGTMYFNSGIMTLGYKGWGLMLPSISPDQSFGTYMDYGNWQNYDGGIHSSYDTAQEYGLSYNPLKFKRATHPYYQDRMAWEWDVSGGLSYLRAASKESFAQSDNSKSVTINAKADIFNLGLLAVGRKPVNDRWVMEWSMGFKRFNLFDYRVSYPNDHQKDPVGPNNVFGLGFAASLPNSTISADYPLKKLTDNFATVRLLADQNFADNLNNTASIGMEMGLIDTAFLRLGYYDNPDGRITGTTYGFGINLHPVEFLTLECNYASFPGGELVDRQDSWDGMILLNGMSLHKRLNK